MDADGKTKSNCHMYDNNAVKYCTITKFDVTSSMYIKVQLLSPVLCSFFAFNIGLVTCDIIGLVFIWGLAQNVNYFVLWEFPPSHMITPCIFY